MNIWIAGTIEDVKKAAKTGLVSAIITNPTVIASWTKNGRSLEEVSREVVTDTHLPLYIQLRGETTMDFLREAAYLKEISDLIVPKIPSTLAGLSAAKVLEGNGTETLITTVVSVNQAYACAAARATTICPYLNRLQEAGEDALAFIKNTAEMYRRLAVKTKIMPASVRSTADIQDALVAGSDGVIIFYPLFLEMFNHPVTAASLKSFNEDWKTIPYKF